MVAVERHPRAQSIGHFQRKKTVSLRPIHPKSNQIIPFYSPFTSFPFPFIPFKKTHSVPIRKRRRTCHRQRIAPNLLHFAHVFAESLRRVERNDVRLPTLQNALFVACAMQEIVRETSVERFFQVGREKVVHAPARSPLEIVGTLPTKRVEPLTIGRHDIFHITDILQPTLNLERNSTDIGQCLQIVDSAEVFQRQKMPLIPDFTPVGIDKVVFHPTHLRTLATIRRATETMLRQIALTAVTHAQRAVYENFQFDIGHLRMNLANLLQRQFPRQHDPTETLRPQPCHFFRRAVVGLRACVESESHPCSPLYGRGAGGEAHILHKNRINANRLKFLNQSERVVEFVIENNRVRRDINLRIELMGIAAKRSNILHRIACRSPCTEARSPDVNGICAVVDGGNATFQILGRSQQFKLFQHPNLKTSKPYNLKTL